MAASGTTSSQSWQSWQSRPVTPMTDDEAKYIESICARYADVPSVSDHLMKPEVPELKDESRNVVNRMVVSKIWWILVTKNLQPFYTQDELDNLVYNACRYDWRMLQRDYNFGTIDVVTDLAVLSLYNVVIIGDDSSSMKTVDAGETQSRWEILKSR